MFSLLCQSYGPHMMRLTFVVFSYRTWHGGCEKRKILPGPIWGGRSGVLGEIADKQGTLLEVKRVLNDGGLLALPLLFAP